MKPLNISELENLVEEAKSLVGGRVQKVTGDAQNIGLEIFKNSETYWLWFVLSSKLPLFFCLNQAPPHRKSTLPVLLFLRAHVVNSKIEEINLLKQKGRIIEFQFSQDDKISRLEFRAIPHACNLIVDGEKKSVSWAKVQELPKASEPPANLEIRSIPFLKKQWQDEQKPKAPLSAVEILEKKKQQIQRSIEKIKQEIELKKQLPWRSVGEELKLVGLPQEASEFVDLEESLSWNIENCFAKAKLNEQKILNAQEKVKALQEKMLDLKDEPESQAPLQKMKELPFKARTLRLNDEVIAQYGKSAADNLKILRYSKPWDLWLHLKDYPSAHAVISKPKGRILPDADLRLIAGWLVRENLAKKNYVGGVFEVIVTETRHVRPIKGDRIGRVTYKNEKILKLKMTDEK